MGTARPPSAHRCSAVQLIPIEDPAAGAPGDGVAAMAMAGLVGCIGTDHFGPQALQHLNRWLPAAWWAVYRLYDDTPPSLHALGCVGVPDRTRQSWDAYRASLYRGDESFESARAHLAQHRMALLHRHSSEIPARHRAAIYSRNGLRERLSLVTAPADGGLLAINLFRHESQPLFSDTEIDQVRRASPLLMAGVERHIALHRPAATAPGVFDGLPPRERAVCERLLKGWTHEGIGADLGIAAATVKTYRDRAFERLGIHHRNELFALALTALSAAQTTPREP